jgi:hypothetical protein
MEKTLTINWMGAEYEVRGIWSTSHDPEEHWLEEFEIIGPDGQCWRDEFKDVFQRVKGCKSLREAMKMEMQSIAEWFENELWEKGS